MMAPYKGLPRKPMRDQLRKRKVRKPKYRVKNNESDTKNFRNVNVGGTTRNSNRVRRLP